LKVPPEERKVHFQPSDFRLGNIPMIAQLLAHKGLKTFLLIVGVLFLIPLLINYSERTERLSRNILNGRDEAVEQTLTVHPELLNRRDKGNGFTPLHWAIIAGRTNLVFWLIEQGADINAADPAGMTPLHKAAVFNRLTCAAALLSAGADVSAFGRKYGALRLMPIHLAAEEGNAEMVELLLKHGADVNATTGGANHITPLHMAAARGRTAVVEKLIADGADINACDFSKKTPLTWAIESEQPAAADMLREAGAVP